MLFLIVLVLVVVSFFGLRMMYFHQDDVDFLIGISSYWPKILFQPVNEHVVIVFWLLYRLEWLAFGTNFGGYLMVSMVLHLLNLFLIGKLVYVETKSRFYALLAALVLTVNNNWNESIWWSTGQMWLMATALILLSLLVVRKKRFRILTCLLILPGLSWGVGLFWPAIVFGGFGVRKLSNRWVINRIGKVAILAQVVILGIYKFLTAAQFSLASLEPMNIMRSVSFVTVGLANTVVGRLIFPWESKPIRLVVLLVVFVWLLVERKKWWTGIKGLPTFLFLATVGIFSTYALGRSSFGIGQAMATRYAYLPTFFFVCAAIMVASRVGSKYAGETKLLILGIYLMLSGLSAFGWRVSDWTIRPRMVKQYFNLVKSKTGQCLVDEDLPGFINPMPTRKLSQLTESLSLDVSFGTRAGCERVLE